MASTTKHHVVLFPYLAKGHMIPMLQFAILLLRRPRINITFFTTPKNLSFVTEYLSRNNAAADVVSLDFPQDIPGIPPGVENTHKLPSVSSDLTPFTRATKMMQPDFERALQRLPPVSFMVSDGFLWWTLQTAKKFGFPRVVFFGMSNYATAVCENIGGSKLLQGLKSDKELVTVPDFPWIKVRKTDFDPLFSDPEPKGSGFELLMEQVTSMVESHSLIVNSFYELEPVFFDYCLRKASLKPWCVGPLCLAEAPERNESTEKPIWMKWLDDKLKQGSSVLYVAFGSQAELADQQVKEIAKGLQKSNVNFMWVTKKKDFELGQGFEERVRERGLVVRDWVNQKAILAHESVQGFLSHCGLNSMMESICAGVPLLAWPLAAEQPLNARMVAEEIRVGLRVVACGERDGAGFVTAEDVEEKVRELMEGEKGKEVRKQVRRYADMAQAAMAEGTGSSWLSLEKLIDELCRTNKMKN